MHREPWVLSHAVQTAKCGRSIWCCALRLTMLCMDSAASMEGEPPVDRLRSHNPFLPLLQEDHGALEEGLGFERFMEGEDRLGWLMNYTPVSSRARSIRATAVTQLHSSLPTSEAFMTTSNASAEHLMNAYDLPSLSLNALS